MANFFEQIQVQNKFTVKLLLHQDNFKYRFLVFNLKLTFFLGKTLLCWD
jgi:hypothetical protein